MRICLTVAAVAALAPAAAAPAFAAQFVANDGFEDVTGNTSPSFFLSDNAGNLTDWTTSSNNDSNNILLLRRATSRPVTTMLSSVSGRART